MSVRVITRNTKVSTCEQSLEQNAINIEYISGGKLRVIFFLVVYKPGVIFNIRILFSMLNCQDFKTRPGIEVPKIDWHKKSLTFPYHWVNSSRYILLYSLLYRCKTHSITSYNTLHRSRYMTMHVQIKSKMVKNHRDIHYSQYLNKNCGYYIHIYYM